MTPSEIVATLTRLLMLVVMVAILFMLVAIHRAITADDAAPSAPIQHEAIPLPGRPT